MPTSSVQQCTELYRTVVQYPAVQQFCALPPEPGEGAREGRDILTEDSGDILRIMETFSGLWRHSQIYADICLQLFADSWAALQTLSLLITLLEIYSGVLQMARYFLVVELEQGGSAN